MGDPGRKDIHHEVAIKPHADFLNSTAWTVGVHWVEIRGKQHIQLIDINLFPMSSKASVGASEQTSERSGARERSEWAVKSMSEAEEQMAQISTLWFHSHSTRCAAAALAAASESKQRRRQQWRQWRRTMGWNYEIDVLFKDIHLPWAIEWVSKRVNEGMSAAKRASEVSSAEQANEWAVRANERMEE